MRPKLPLLLAAVATLAVAGCSTSPCQRLGEKLCACTGLAGDVCTTQVEDQLKGVHMDQDLLTVCQKYFDSCHEPTGTVFCEWLVTETGQQDCGLTPEVVTSTTP